MLGWQPVSVHINTYFDNKTKKKIENFSNNLKTNTISIELSCKEDEGNTLEYFAKQSTLGWSSCFRQYWCCRVFFSSPYNLSKGSSVFYGMTVLKSMLCQHKIIFSLFYLRLFLVFSLTCFITLFLTRHLILVLNSVFSVKMWCLSFFLTLNLAWFLHGMYKYADMLILLMYLKWCSFMKMSVYLNYFLIFFRSCVYIYTHTYIYTSN